MEEKMSYNTHQFSGPIQNKICCHAPIRVENLMSRLIIIHSTFCNHCFYKFYNYIGNLKFEFSKKNLPVKPTRVIIIAWNPK